jgi:osmotically-inducible protein OsmY
MTRQALASGIIAVAVIAAACSQQTEERAEEAARATGAAVESAAGDAVRNAERVGEAATDAVRDASHDTQVGGAAAAAIETLDVKAALMADKRVDASGINVDTDHKTKTVTLKGYVPSTDQRMTAEEIAREKAKGYTIHNELVVQPPAKK